VVEQHEIVKVAELSLLPFPSVEPDGIVILLEIFHFCAPLSELVANATCGGLAVPSWLINMSYMESLSLRLFIGSEKSNGNEQY